MYLFNLVNFSITNNFFPSELAENPSLNCVFQALVLLQFAPRMKLLITRILVCVLVNQLLITRSCGCKLIYLWCPFMYVCLSQSL